MITSLSNFNNCIVGPCKVPTIDQFDLHKFLYGYCKVSVKKKWFHLKRTKQFIYHKKNGSIHLVLFYTLAI